MNMKSTIIQSLCAAILLGAGASLASCSPEGENVQTVSRPLNNLVIPADPDGEVKVDEDVSYTIKYDYGTGNAMVTSDEMTVGDITGSLSTDEMPFQQAVYTAGTVRKFSGAGKLGNANDPVTDFSGIESGLFFFYPTPVPGLLDVYQINTAMLFKYTIGDYIVKTFPRDIYYGGETVTRIAAGPNAGSSFSSKEAIYRIYFAKGLKKAIVVIYNAKFAEKMPVQKFIVLEDLDVTYTRSGFVIEGENVTPKHADGDALTEHPGFIINSFRFSSSGEYLAKGICSYTVNGGMYGNFEGSYVQY